MNILITGATGFIGFSLAQRLSADGHRIIACARRAEEWRRRIPAWQWQSCDFARDTRPDIWADRIATVDLVINAVGIIAESRAQSFAQVQTQTPQALFTACSRAHVKVIQVSAMGADRDGVSIPFLNTKKLADDLLWQLPGECIVLYPSVVIGQGGTSTAVFNKLSALPLIPLIGSGEQKMNPVHIDDFCAAVSHMVGHWPGGKQRYQISGATIVSMREFHVLLRDWLRLGKARFLPMPLTLMRLLATLAEMLRSRGLLSNDALDMLENSPTPANTYTAQPPRPLSQALWARPAAPSDTWYAIMQGIRPALFASLLFIWLFTGLTSAFWDLPSGYALLKAGGIEGALGTAAIYSGAAFDVALGLLMLSGRQRRHIYALQIALMLAYMVLISFLVPTEWLHPFGPVTKNLPMLAGTWLLLALEPRAGERHLKAA